MNERERMSGKEFEAVAYLHAFSTLLEKYKDRYESIAKRVPNGWRDFRLVQTLTNNIEKKVLNTMPKDQLAKIIVHFRTHKIASVATRPGQMVDGYWVLSEDDLAYLLHLAVDGTCAICDYKKGKRCRLRKILLDTKMELTNSGQILMGCMMDE